MIRVLSLLVLIVLSSLPAWAEEAPHVRFQVTPGKTAVAPGETVYVAIEQDIADGWHTYWANPGDSGQPLRVEWDAASGFTGGILHWPAPHVQPIDTLVNYGYTGDVAILQELTAPDTLEAGPVTVPVTLHVLVCKDICIPESARFEVRFNQDGTQDNSAVIDEAFRNIPVRTPWQTRFYEEDGDFVLDLWLEQPALIGSFLRDKGFTFFPYQDGVVSYAAPQSWRIVDRGGPRDKHLIIRQSRGFEPLQTFDDIRGVIAYTNQQGERHALDITAYPDSEKIYASGPAAGDSTPVPVFSPEETDASAGLWQALLFAVLGGLILNLMPCVFPILSMKALSLCNLSDKENREARLHGLEYTAGVLLSFALIAGVLIALKSAGGHIGWGFHLQNPVIVLFLTYLLFVIGLNLSGLFEIKGAFANLGSRLTQGGHAGSFFTGVLATIVATPCTAPFMGVAMGYALTQPPVVAIGVFLALGFGLSLPYLALSFVPALRGWLPRPGPWMVTFREFLAFPLYASAAWLIWVYAQQSSPVGVLAALAGMVAIAFSIWIFHRRSQGGVSRFFQTGLAVLCLAGALAIPFFDHGPLKAMCGPLQDTIGLVKEEPFSAERFAALEQGDEPLFVNMTASWCITCKINERVALNTMTTHTLFVKNNVRFLRGDWTNKNPEITDFLEGFDRQGVPLYVYYGPRDPATGVRPDPVVLPQILTPATLRATIAPEGT